MAVAEATALNPGDWVEVKSAAEILATLDGNGTLDALPFMPEMLDLCGRRFQVLRKAEKTCVEIAPGDYAIREFLHNDVVLLDGQRCSGASHEGCQRLCMFFWKANWLRRVDPHSVSSPEDIGSRAALRDRLKTTTTAGRYFCQSTQLHKATSNRALTRSEILRKCFRDVRSGAVRPLAMLALIFVPLYRKTRDRLVGRPWLRGTLSRTPVGNLALQPGEFVVIKSIEEMRTTLDSTGKNRGLVCDIELQKFSGTTDRVRGRLDRMISEPTGEMRQVQGTVILEGNTCMCARVVGGCPRLEYCYWREVWLSRVDATMPQAAGKGKVFA